MGCVGPDEHLPGAGAGAAAAAAAASAKVPEDTLSASRIKFLCSHGGKILPKPDGQLRYVGGDTRLVSFNKNITFADLSSKLEKLFGPNLCLKYQLPNEDLDTLISVTCDDDVENLVEEYDKNEARDGASRLRAFLFPWSGMSVRDGNPCSCHVLDEAKSPKAFDTITASRSQVVECSCAVSAALHAPDCLFGLESACCVHGCQRQHHEGDSQLSPRLLVDDKGLATKTSTRPISPTTIQGEYLRQQSSKFVDSVGRGPALTTSALGPLVSTHHQHTWDRRKAWEEGSASFNQRGGDDKRHMELNPEIHYHNIQQDVGMGIPMIRVSSKDRMVPGYMEGDSQATLERQSRPQSIPRSDHHLEMADPLAEVRHDGIFQGSARLYKPSDVQRVNAAQSEMQWALAGQPVGPSFHPVGERSTESHRNSVDSDEGPSSHRKLEGHAAADTMPHSVPVVIMPEVSHGMKMQEVYRHEDTMLKPVRHGEFEAPSAPVQGQHEHFHHLSKSHFQQAHWQAHEPQEQPQHHQGMGLEPIRVGHGTHGIPRHAQSSLDFHSPSQGMVAHHHHMICAPSNVRRSDTSSVNRLPSPLYRQVASGNSSRPDPPSPHRGQLPSGGSHYSSRPAVRALHVHDVGYLPSSKAPHAAGLTGNHVYMNAAESHGVYDQHGNQVHLTDKGTLTNLEASMNQAQYFDKMILANSDGAIGQVHCDDDLQYGGASNNHDVQGVPP